MTQNEFLIFLEAIFYSVDILKSKRHSPDTNMEDLFNILDLIKEKLETVEKIVKSVKQEQFLVQQSGQFNLRNQFSLSQNAHD